MNATEEQLNTIRRISYPLVSYLKTTGNSNLKIIIDSKTVNVLEGICLIDETEEPINQITHDAPISAIQFALETDDGLQFLELWNSGEFDDIREEWPDCPEECFIGAEVGYKPKEDD